MGKDVDTTSPVQVESVLPCFQPTIFKRGRNVVRALGVPGRAVKTVTLTISQLGDVCTQPPYIHLSHKVGDLVGRHSTLA